MRHSGRFTVLKGKPVPEMTTSGRKRQLLAENGKRGGWAVWYSGTTWWGQARRDSAGILAKMGGQRLKVERLKGVGVGRRILERKADAWVGRRGVGSTTL